MYLRVATKEYSVEKEIPLIPKGMSSRIYGVAVAIPIVVVIGSATATTILHVLTILILVRIVTQS